MRRRPRVAGRRVRQLRDPAHRSRTWRCCTSPAAPPATPRAPCTCTRRWWPTTPLGPVTHLEFVNAEIIAAQRWPDDPAGRSYDAAAAAAGRRAELIAARRSFVSETVFSHESKLDLVRAAVDSGYRVTLHVVTVPEPLAVARVANRVDVGGHTVPEEKVRSRYRRLWPLVASAIDIVDTATVSDNTRARTPFRVVACFERGVVVGTPDWPPWTPGVLRQRGASM